VLDLRNNPGGLLDQAVMVSAALDLGAHGADLDDVARQRDVERLLGLLAGDLQLRSTSR
jgi:hypothetical protein